MRLSSIAHLYRIRLKARVVLVQELLAVLGLSVGVALLFASQVASASLNGSVQQLTNGIVGQTAVPARVTRSARLRRTAAGRGAAATRCQCRDAGAGRARERHRPVRSAGRGPDRRRSALSKCRRSAAATFPLRDPRPSAGACACPNQSRRRSGRGSLQQIKLQVGASVVPAFLAATLQAAEVGALVNSPVAVAPLAYAQKLTGMRGRITRIFVAGDDPGRAARCGPGW